ncbi:MAG: hypothetical protein AB1894_02490 [Chloroflexota bacterium]
MREDHWSEGAARVATRLGLQAKSFSLATEAYEDAVGGGISRDSLRRITEGWGQKVEEKREAEAKQMYEAEVPQPVEQVVTVHEPIQRQANLSSDGGMILLRQEGWKEVKMCVFSQVNDGAVWIDRVNASNFPQAIQIIDWRHSDERLWKVAKAAFGENTPQAKLWAEERIDQLWLGRTSEVVYALNALDWSQITCPEDIPNLQVTSIPVKPKCNTIISANKAIPLAAVRLKVASILSFIIV